MQTSVGGGFSHSQCLYQYHMFTVFINQIFYMHVLEWANSLLHSTWEWLGFALRTIWLKTHSCAEIPSISSHFHRVSDRKFRPLRIAAITASTAIFGIYSCMLCDIKMTQWEIWLVFRLFQIPLPLQIQMIFVRIPRSRGLIFAVFMG